jgi:hypothetical protein
VKFQELTSEMYQSGRKPRTRLEAVAKKYAWANSHELFDIVVDNYSVLRRAGVLEEALIQAWSGNKYGKNWDDNFFRLVFSNLDKSKLRQASDPLPEGEVFTIYRGVNGPEAMRRVRGYCWSLDKAVARFFSKDNFAPIDPAVYRGKIQREHILAYIHESGRREQEVIVLPEHVTELERLGWHETRH